MHKSSKLKEQETEGDASHKSHGKKVIVSYLFLKFCLKEAPEHKKELNYLPHYGGERGD